MKVQVTFKTPDAVDDAITEQCDEETMPEAYRVINQYVRYGEFVTIEFDLDTGAATVVLVK